MSIKNTDMKRILVYSKLDHKQVYALVQSTNTLLVPRKRLLINSDVASVIDKHGYKYARDRRIDRYDSNYMHFKLI